MAFEGLTERLQNAMTKLRRKGKVSEADVREMMREVRLALLEADVNFKVVKEFVNKVSERAIGTEVLDSLSPGQQIIKIVNDELTELMGGETATINYSVKPPTVVMMVGLQGAGKTTTAGKIANYVRKNDNKRPLLVAADIYRPAAIQQLQTIGNQLDMPVFTLGDQVSPVEIAQKGIEEAVRTGRDLVLIDTAGRLHVDENLMTELSDIKKIAEPSEIFLVVDAMTGQDAVNVAKSFNEQLDVTGVVLTKLDGDTRGGAALSIRSVTGKPIKFVGQGEKLDALEPFHPDRMANRILGMGDMLTLIEKAQQDIDEKKAEEMAEKLRDNSFDFNDFIDQMDQVSNMGPLEDIIKMIPGMNNMPGLDQLQIDPKDTARMKAIVLSMTPKERENPDIISQSRRKRIAKGSGRPLVEVNRLIKQFNESKKMMNKMSNGNFQGMDNLFGNGVKGKLGKLAMNQMARKNKKKKKKNVRKKKK
ncbi:signal recognition particle protein [Desemzia incerta]|uniref:Signal recognition particle protein n=1 Tax=Desemzia incerta TaxID=82801 RepID=A0A1I5WUD4_9LACT|nr:signal recognition particle protein [Desemzia incerta]WHZ31566.1 signal recognition particle protein [Desemzia incerta]SFQ23116.1 signal recognition particle subunit FFH/SRP54 (srp54) [Desemzia incerta]